MPENISIAPDVKQVKDGRLYANWDAYWQGFMSNSMIEVVRFYLIRKACERILRSFQPPKSGAFCELGAGTGAVSRWLGDTYGAQIYLVDNNPKAAVMIEHTFKDFHQPKTLIPKDVFSLAEYKNKFDLVHSGGLIEHFVNAKREEIIQVHCDLVGDKGYIMILVPVRNLWYRLLNEGIFKAMHLLDEIKEVPWSYAELASSLEQKGFKIIARTNVVTEIGVLAQRQ